MLNLILLVYFYTILLVFKKKKYLFINFMFLLFIVFINLYILNFSLCSKVDYLNYKK